MKKDYNALVVRLGGVDVRVKTRPRWKQVEFTETGLKKLRAALAKKANNVSGVTLVSDRDNNADLEFESFDFGENVVVLDSDGWETTTGSDDWQKNVFIENDEDPEGDSLRLSFHVEFKKSSTLVKDVYCLDFISGVMVGRRGKRSKR